MPPTATVLLDEIIPKSTVLVLIIAALVFQTDQFVFTVSLLIIVARHVESPLEYSTAVYLIKPLPSQRQQSMQKPKSQSNSTAANNSSFSPAFNKFDIQQTSYHVNTGRIDIHICDDINGKHSRLWLY